MKSAATIRSRPLSGVWGLIPFIVLALTTARASAADSALSPKPPDAPPAVAPTLVAPIAKSAFDDQPINRDLSPAPSASHDLAPSSKFSTVDTSRIVLALGGVLLLIVLLKAAARKLLPGAAAHRSTRVIKVVTRCPITPRQHLLLVQIGRKLVMVGDSGAQLNPLCEVTDPDEVAQILGQIQEESSSIIKRFDTFFGRARKGYTEDQPAPTPTETSSVAPQPDDADSNFDPTHEINDPSLLATRKELSGLSEKVRDLARQLGDA